MASQVGTRAMGEQGVSGPAGMRVRVDSMRGSRPSWGCVAMLCRVICQAGSSAKCSLHKQLGEQLVAI